MGTLISGGLLAILVDAWLWILAIIIAVTIGIVKYSINLTIPIVTAIIIAVTIGIVKLILYLTGKYWG